MRQPWAHTPAAAAGGDWADGPSDDRLSAAIAVPAVDGRRVLAVVELKRDREIVLGDRLMRSLCGISHELGYFLARRGGELAAALLTPREIEVLQLAADGLSATLSADRLAVSVATIRSHLEHIYRKLGATDRASAVSAALRLGIIA
jgi:DNA-binding CsgD family transcriptional regulator